MYDLFNEKVVEPGAKAEADWNELVAAYKSTHPELGAQFERAMNNELPEGWDSELPTFEVGSKKATRQTSGEVLNAIAKAVPTLFGGSADLAGSNNTMIKGAADFDEDPAGRNIWFGVREFAMAAAVNGMALHGGVLPYGATFFVFSDYLRSSGSTRGPHGNPIDVRLDARFDRGRRRWPDARAGRALDELPCDAKLVCPPSC